LDKKGGVCERCGQVNVAGSNGPAEPVRHASPEPPRVPAAEVQREPAGQVPVGAARSEDRPWTPLQVFAMSFLFGPVAGGVIAGINFARLGKRQYLVPSILAGAVLFVLVAGASFLVPGTAGNTVGLLANLGVGYGLLWAQQPSFAAWKAAMWAPAKEGEPYKSSRFGQLFLVSLVCLGIEVGALVGALVLVGQW